MMDERLRQALEIARWAPSAHNTQPWTVEQQGSSLVVRADERRALRHGDPTGRDLALSAGGFAEALRLAFLAVGAEYALSPEAGAIARLTSRGECPRDGAGASLLRQRQTSRLPYSPRPPEGPALEALGAAAVANGFRLHLAHRGTPEHASCVQWFHLASRESWLDPRANAELAAWIRWDPEGARRPKDGLSTHCLGLGTTEAAGLILTLRPSLWKALSFAYAAPALAEQLARVESAQVERTPVVGVLIEERGEPLAGARLLRVWLEATRLRLAFHPLSALLDRRGWELGKSLGVAPTRLVFAFRLGHSAPPPRAGRRAAESLVRT
jgi:hypothetical protein